MGDKLAVRMRGWLAQVEESRIGQFFLTTSPLLAAGAAITLAESYFFPEEWNVPTTSRHLIAVLLGGVIGLGVWVIRASIDATRARQMYIKQPPYTEVRAELANAYQQVPGEDRSGWAHYLGPYPDPQVPTPLSTAYGLSLHMLVGTEVPKIEPVRCRELIAAGANQDHGWSVQSQRGVARSEVTAVIAAVLARSSGLDEHLRAAILTIEDAVSSGSDRLATSNTYVVSTILEHSPYLGFSEDLMRRLTAALCDGARREDGTSAYFWTESLPASPAQASTAMTAYAVIALHTVLETRSQVASARAREVLSGGYAWLERHADLRSVDTRLIRPTSPGVEDLNAPTHFTAALVVYALSMAGRTRSSLFARALNEVWKRFDGGAWMLDDGHRPTWMAYLGMRALVAWSNSDRPRSRK